MMPTRWGRHVAVVVALVGLGRLAAAQSDNRTFTVSRALTDSTPMSVRIEYGVGTLHLSPATSPVLYAATIKYQAEHVTPVATFDTKDRTLNLGMKDANYTMPNDEEGSELNVQLGKHVPLDLKFDIGAAEAHIQLGGLSVRSLKIDGGATETTVAFDSANGISMQSLGIDVGAAELDVSGLANARASNITINGAAGNIDLYFDGTWTTDILLKTDVALGRVHVHVPQNIRVTTSTKAILGVVDNSTESGSHHFRHRVHTNGVMTMDSTSDMRNMGMDSSDMSDDDDDTPAHSSAKPPSSAKTAPSSGQAQPFTLTITGSATLGSISVDHDMSHDNDN
jgi:hypothetical protein